MTTPARSGNQKSAPIYDQSPTLTLPEDYEHVAARPRRGARRARWAGPWATE